MQENEPKRSPSPVQIRQKSSGSKCSLGSRNAKFMPRLQDKKSTPRPHSGYMNQLMKGTSSIRTQAKNINVPMSEEHQEFSVLEAEIKRKLNAHSFEPQKLHETTSS